MLVIKLLLLFVKVNPLYYAIFAEVSFYEKWLVVFNVYPLFQMKWLITLLLPSSHSFDMHA
jgi:hypothetical protein